MPSVTSLPAARHAQPAVCTPSVWASSLSTNSVYGYTAPSSTPCKTITGAYFGKTLNAPIALAMGLKPQYLYVADLNNDRILVFNNHGGIVKWFKTDIGTTLYQPWGVCVSTRGVVGVGNRQYNNTGSPGNVEFFHFNQASGTGPYGTGSSFLLSDSFCAFDDLGNFFVDGTALAANGGGQQIGYLARAHVVVGNHLIKNSGLGNASFWVGMYSRIDSPTDQTLSVGTSVGNATTQLVDSWTVAGPAAGPLTFTPTASSPYGLTGYPATTDAVYQLAPSTGGSLGLLYVADYGDGYILDSAANGGAVANYNPVGGTVGVTTYPTGQY
jgi:hypothetical protein